MIKIGLKTPSPGNPRLLSAEASLCTWQGLYKAPSREDPSVIQSLMVNASDGLLSPERPIHTYEQREQATITALKKYFTLGGCLVLKRQYIHTSRKSNLQ